MAHIKKVIGATSPFFATQYDDDNKPRVERLIKAWSDNQGALVAELIDARSRKQERSYSGLVRIKNKDHIKRAQELGAGNLPSSIPFINPQRAARDHAEFLCTGQVAFASQVRFKISPAPSTVEPGYGIYAIFLLEWAAADILANERPALRERDHIRALQLYGECLMVLGRKTDAIAKWQIILDTYPTSSEFPKVEKKIKEALGVK